MKYEVFGKDKRDILDESNITEVLNNIKSLIGKDFEVKIETQAELSNFIKRPGDFLQDEEIIKEITELKELIEMMGVYYNG